MAEHTRPVGQGTARHSPANEESATPPAEHEGHNTGKLSSWLAVLVMIIGFVVGGLGLILGPSWPLFWVGIGVIGIGGVYALASGIMEDYG